MNGLPIAGNLVTQLKVAAFGFSADAKRECDRLWMEEKVSIQLVTVKQLIEKDFRKELEYLRMVGR